MRILLTNDDGIHAPGLVALEKIARQLSDDVHVVAPETDQSGVSHSVTLNDPLRMRRVSENRHAVKGTPTDCVLMAVHLILRDHKPDLVLSGVNHGQNIAEDVVYSGTIAAAMEATILGIPAIALSQGFAPGGRDNVSFECAETHAPGLLRRVLKLGIEPNALVNINFPARAANEIEGIELTTQGRRDMDLVTLDERADGRGKPYYWVRYSRARKMPPAGSDLEAVYNGKISVTPLRIDLTDPGAFQSYRAEFAK